MMMVDTSVWSLAFRRDSPPESPAVDALKLALARGDAVVSTGLILQELLQGFTGARARDRLVERFAALPMLMPERSDHIEAAALRNLCRRRGVQLGTIDALLVHLCLRHNLMMLSVDRDFEHASIHCALKLWRADSQG